MEYDGALDELRASTRNGSTLKFDQQGLVRALDSGEIPTPPVDVPYFGKLDTYVLWAPTGESVFCDTMSEARALRAEYEKDSPSCFWRIGHVSADGLILSDNIDTKWSWDSLAKSKIFGMIQNRMYVGSWNTDVEQDFRLKYVSKSWVSKRGELPSVNEGVKMTFANSTSFAFHDVVSLIRNARNKEWAKSEYLAGRLSLEECNALRARFGYPPLKDSYMRKLMLGPAKVEKILEREFPRDAVGIGRLEEDTPVSPAERKAEKLVESLDDFLKEHETSSDNLPNSPVGPIAEKASSSDPEDDELSPEKQLHGEIVFALADAINAGFRHDSYKESGSVLDKAKKKADTMVTSIEDLLKDL